MYHHGELDDRLCPIRSLKGTEYVPQKKLQKKIEIYEFIYRNPVLYGSSWTQVSKASLSRVIVEMNGSHIPFTVGLLTPISTNIPDIQFPFRMNNKDVKSFVYPIKGHVLLTPERYEKLNYFHFWLFTSVLRSKFTLTDSFALLVIPIKQIEGNESCLAEDMVDWALLEKSFNVSPEPVHQLIESGTLEKQDLMESILYDRIHYKRRFHVLDFLDNLNPNSTEIPPGLFLGKHKSPLEYYSYRLKCKLDILPNQPIIAVEPVPPPLLT